MEILGPEILALAERIAFVATMMSAVVLAACIAVRWGFDRQVKRDEHFRREAEPLVTAFLAGRADEQKAAALLQREPAESLPLLMEISDRLETAERARLRPLFAALPLKDQETARLQHRRWEFRLRAAERLGYFGDPSSAVVLRRALQDDVLSVRFAAARSLVVLGDDAALEEILLAFDLPGEMNQRRIAEILYAFGPAATDRLIAVVENDGGKFSDSVVSVAARVLGMLRAKKAVPALTALLPSPEFRLRLNAARSLGLIGDRSALPAVQPLLDDASWEVRNATIQALAKLEAREAIPAFRKALGDEAWWVRFSAGSALYAMGDSGIDALRETMSTSTDRYARDMSRQILEEKRISEARERKS